MKKSTFDLSNEKAIEFYKTNSINRNDTIHAFLEMLCAIEGSYTIAIDGEWGSGKSFFVKQLELLIEDSNNNSNNILNDTTLLTKIKDSQFIPLYYDAWENDDDYDPLLSLLFAISEKVNLSLTDYTTITANLLNQIAQKFIGINYNSAIESGDIVEQIRYNKKIKSEINKYLSSILLENGNKLIIIIDELDRCNPQYAVKMLERVKHYFNNDYIIFIFSTNISELQHTICNYYGLNFSGSKYLDKFFDSKYYLDYVDPKLFLQNTNNTLTLIATTIAETLNLQIRHLCKLNTLLLNIDNKYRSFINHSTEIDNEYLGYMYLYLIFIPISYSLKILDSCRYIAFINGDERNLIYKIIHSIHSKNKSFSLKFLKYILNENNSIDQNKLNHIHDYVIECISNKSEHIENISLRHNLNGESEFIITQLTISFFKDFNSLL